MNFRKLLVCRRRLISGSEPLVPGSIAPETDGEAKIHDKETGRGVIN